MAHPVILFEDNHLIAAEKRSGQTVQPEPGKPPSLEEEVKEYIRVSKGKPGDVFLGVIHRIDMPVSGIVLFARTSKALARMNAMFQDRSVQKIYTVKVEGRPPREHDTVTHFLKRDEKRNFSKAFVNEVKDSSRSQLRYTVVKATGRHSWLEVELLTGRKHQIRAQLSAIGCPIEGDVKYGALRPNPDQSISLHASKLVFMHPVKEEEVRIESTAPFARP